jgi:hypothetical protein
LKQAAIDQHPILSGFQDEAPARDASRRAEELQCGYQLSFLPKIVLVVFLILG